MQCFYEKVKEIYMQRVKNVIDTFIRDAHRFYHDCL